MSGEDRGGRDRALIAKDEDLTLPSFFKIYLLALYIQPHSPSPTHLPPAMVPKPEVAIAILYQGDRFLLQLRDDIPTIAWPGHWAFFGGHLEPGESADVAVQRELMEEIGYAAPQLALFQRLEAESVVRHVYHGPLVVPVDSLLLTEGLDLGLWSVDDIRQGKRYSARAKEERPIGPPHQQILLSFLGHRRIEQAPPSPK